MKWIQSIEKGQNFDFSEVDSIFAYCYMKNVYKSGVVYGWGSDEYGQLTDLHTDDCQVQPTELANFGTVTDIFATDTASFVIKDEEIFAIGVPGLGNSLPPKHKLPKVKSLTTSLSLCFAVDTKGRLWSWGPRRYQDRHQTRYQASRFNSNIEGLRKLWGKPHVVEPFRPYKIKQVSASQDFACFLTSDGQVFTWRWEDSYMPQNLDIEKVSQISCGLSHTQLLSMDQKTLWAIGRNNYGQLGLGTEFENAITPIKVPFTGEKVIKKLQCVGNDSAILTADGQITVWGSSWNEENPTSPRIISLNQKVVDISMGLCFMLALTVDNRLYAFGENHHGQCGQGTITWPTEEPVEVKNLENLYIKQISTGYHHCLIKCTRT